MTSLHGKLAFITGGSSGIGLETARLMAENGCRLVLFARKKGQLEDAFRYIKEQATPRVDADKHISVKTMDVADNVDVHEKIKASARQFGVPDILINCAGIGAADYFENIDYNTFDQVMKVNLYGTRNTVSAIVPFMKEYRKGHIVNISSLAGLIGIFGYSLYSSSKYALVGFSECLRSELKRYNIRVTLVCPPEVDTPFLQEEAKTIPQETRALKPLTGRLTSEHTSGSIIKGIKRNRFLVIPGFTSKFSFFVHRLSNGRLSRFSSDIIVSLAARR